MAVRVRVRLRFGEKELVTVALANSGYETESPEIVLPQRAAESLGLYPRLPEGSVVEEYRAVGGVGVRAFVSGRPVEVEVLAGDRVSRPVNAIPVVTPGEDEVIISDSLIDRLGIELIRPGKGYWRFSDDPPGKVRVSEPPERW